MIRHVPVVLVPLLLGACAVGPSYQTPPTSLPPAFVETTAISDPSQPPTAWWEGFNDPSLNALVQKGLTGNLDIAIAEARIRQARADLDAARAQSAPQLDLSADATRQRLSRNSGQLLNVPPGFEPTVEYSQYTAGFDASWEIDLFGGNQREAEASAARSDSAEASRDDAALSVSAEIARNYFTYRMSQTRLVLAQATVASTGRSLDLITQRQRAGEVGMLDVRQAASSLSDAEAAIPLLEVEARAALYALDVLTGATAGTTEASLQSASPPSLDPPSNAAIGVPSDLLRRRPDIRRAERDLAAATGDLGVAIADQYPQFSLTAALGLQSVEVGDFTDAASRYWRIAPSLVAPLLDGGRRRAVRRGREAALDEALARYRASVLTALADVETAIIRFDRTQARTVALSASLAEQEATAALTRSRHTAGEVGLIDVLEAERRVTRATDALQASRAEALLAFVTLQKSLGAGLQRGIT